MLGSRQDVRPDSVPNNRYDGCTIPSEPTHSVKGRRKPVKTLDSFRYASNLGGKPSLPSPNNVDLLVELTLKPSVLRAARTSSLLSGSKSNSFLRASTFFS